MKILHVITSLLTGGAEKLMVDILPQLRERGNEVDLCVFDGTQTPLYKQLQSLGIRIIPFSDSGGVYNPLHIYRLWMLMRKYEIVHTHNTAAQLFAAVAGVLCSVRLVTTEHSTFNRRRHWKWYACIDRWMYSRYQMVICISNQAEENLRQYIHSIDNICTIFNGVDIGLYAESPINKEIAKGYEGLRLATMVAGFRWEKDQDTLIRAYQYLPNEYHLLLVGDGVRRHECEDLAMQIGVADRVHFMGIRTDVPSILKTVDVVAMSSHFEGLSLSNIEGMASGTPFVASDVDGVREVTKGYGVLCKHGEAQEFASAIRRLTEDKFYAAQVAEACKRRAAEYDICKMVDKYIEVYKKILFQD